MRNTRSGLIRLTRTIGLSIGVCGISILVVSGASQGASAPSRSANEVPLGSGLACQAPNQAADHRVVELLRRLNADRANAGVAQLAWNPQLYCLALQWSEQQADVSALTHQDLSSLLEMPRFERYDTLGENLLRGPATIDGDEMYQAWKDSPSHRANLFDPSFTSVAIALFYASDGSVYATQTFAG